MPVPAAVAIELSDDERALLEGFTRRWRGVHGLAQRSRIVLEAAEGRTNSEIAERLGVGRPTVTRWRRRFAERRVEGLVNEPRPGRSRTITDEQVEEVVVKTLETTPTDATHWSTRSMAAEVGLTQNAILRIWHAYGLQPHRQERFKLSKDPLFVDKVHDVVGLYLNPPERAVVLFVSRRSPRSRRWTGPRRSCRCARAHPSASRTTTGALGPRACTPRWTSPPARSSPPRTSVTARSSSSFLQAIDRQVPDGLDVHLVLDNSSTHNTPAI